MKHILRMAMSVAVLLCTSFGVLGASDDSPCVQISAPESLNETDMWQSVQIGVNYWDGSVLTARVEVVESSPGRQNPGLLKLDSAYVSQLPGEDNVYYVELGRGRLREDIAIESMDGTDVSSTYGFVIRASIVSSEINYASGQHQIYINNDAPTCRNVTNPNSPLFAWTAMVGASAHSIRMGMVNDVDSDMADGIRVSFSGCDNANSYMLTSWNVYNEFAPVFNTPGNHVVTLTVADKDGGSSAWHYNYVVYASETIDGVVWRYLAQDGNVTIVRASGEVTGAIVIPSALGTYPVTSIGASAFSECNELTSATIPECVTNIGDFAFSGCASIVNVVFNGNAPTCGDEAFEDIPSGCVVYVSPRSSGWGVAVGEDWHGLTFQYWPEVLTAVESAAEAHGILSEFADARIAAGISTVGEYNQLADWANGNNLYQPALKDSLHVWASYVLGAERLFENEPTVEIDDVAVATGVGGGLGTDRPAMTVSVIVKDGEKAVAVNQEKVAAMFEATNDIGDWAGAALPVAVEVVDDGGASASHRMRFRATPGGSPSKAFLRIRR